MVYPRKSRGVAFVLCLLFGWLGAHRFYTGNFILGLLYFFTCGFLFIGVFIDLIMIVFNGYRDSNGRYLG